MRYFASLCTRFARLAIALGGAAWLILGLGVGWISAQAQIGENARVSEDELRAAVVVAILRYTTWSHRDPGASSIRLCSVGDALSARVLNRHSRAISNGTFSLEVMMIEDAQPGGDCDVLLIGAEFTSGLAEPLSGGGANAFFTICDGCDVERVPSVVTLLRASGFIRFEVDLERARAAGLSFSSEMLELAVRVKMDAS